MSAIPNAMKVAYELVSERRYAEIGRRTAGLAFDRRITYGLRRDLAIPIKYPLAKIPISIREMQEGDLPALFDKQEGLTRREKIELATRRAHYDAHIPRCYVAVDDRSGDPCYFQWLMGPQENHRIQSFFPVDWFPVLHKDEALLENAYTPIVYRGKGIMSAAMALIAEHASDIGCRYVITFVERGNIPSLKGCRNAGFSPYLTRTEQRFLANTIKKRSFSRFTEAAEGMLA